MKLDLYFFFSFLQCFYLPSSVFFSTAPSSVNIVLSDYVGLVSTFLGRTINDQFQFAFLYVIIIFVLNMLSNRKPWLRF